MNAPQVSLWSRGPLRFGHCQLLNELAGDVHQVGVRRPLRRQYACMPDICDGI